MKQILCVAWAFFALGIGYLHAQDCECDKNYEKIFVDQKDKWMHGMYHDDKQLGGHPYSTFSKTHPGSYIEGNTNPKARLDAIRNMVQDFQKTVVVDPNTSPIGQAKKIYDRLYDLAIDGRPAPDYQVGKASKYPHNIAYVAKATAFVYLCDMDKSGNKLHDSISARMRNKAIFCLRQIVKDDVNDMINSIGLNFSDVPTYCQRYSKNLIMYAQAYDYLRAVSDGMNHINPAATIKPIVAPAMPPADPNWSKHTKFMFTNGNNTYADLEDTLNMCGLYVQCYAQKLYKLGSAVGSTPLYRPDNHAIMTATALGVTGIILNDFSHKNSQKSWHPDLWAATAHQTIDRVLYTENFGPVILGQTQKGGLYGYQEGPYYLKWGSENMLPFMLAFKNFHPETEVNNSYVNKQLWLKGTVSIMGAGAISGYLHVTGPLTTPVLTTAAAILLSNKLLNERTLEVNYMDDENIINMYRWATELERPDGSLPTIDDSWDSKPFFDKAILREPGLMRNYLAKGYSHNLKYKEPDAVLVEFGLDYIEDKSVDLRADIYAAFAEGFYNDLPRKEYRYPIQQMKSGDLVIRNNTVDNPLGARLLPSD